MTADALGRLRRAFSRRYYTPLTALYDMPLVDFLTEADAAAKEAKEEATAWQKSKSSRR